MLFTASLIVFFYCIFHYRQSLKLLGHKLFLDNNNTGTIFGKHKFVNKEDMSDEEFRDPLAAINHWNKIKEKKGFTPGNTSLFQWKKEPEVSDIVRNAKRPKITASCEEISDDQSDVSIIEDSVSKKVDSNKVCDDEDSTNNQNSKSEKSSFKNIKTLQYVKKIEKLKSFNKYTQAVSNASLPTGMPPIIAGVAVLFPITPYKSQISVMNAVIKGCKNSENCLLESPTGSGKTLALLCAALAWQSHFVHAEHNQDYLATMTSSSKHESIFLQTLNAMEYRLFDSNNNWHLRISLPEAFTQMHFI